MRFLVIVLVLVGWGALPGWGQDLSEREMRIRVTRAEDRSVVAGAEVFLYGKIRREAARDVVGKTETDAQGAAMFEPSARPGARLLIVRAPGRAEEQVLLREEDDLVYEVSLFPGRTVRGRVVDQVTGAPIVGARVWTEVRAIEVAADGSFTFEGLSAELGAEASAAAPGYVPTSIVFQAGSTTAEVVLEPGHVIAVRVVDEEGKPVLGAEVRARIPRAVAYSAVERGNYGDPTDADGISVLRGLPPDQPILLEAEKDGRITSPAAPILPERPRGSGAPSIGCTLVLSRGRPLIVRVEDEFGRPLEGAGVRVLPLVEPLLDFAGYVARDLTNGALRLGETGLGGKVEFEFVPLGPLTVEARAAGYLTQMDVVHVTADSGSQVTFRLADDPSPPHDHVPWTATIGEAFAEADRSGSPILFSMAMDGERANDRIASHHLRDPEVIRVLREFPTLISSVFGAGGVAPPRGVDHDELDGQCTRYGEVPCAAHQKVEPYCVANFIDPGIPFQVPRQILITPDGEVLEHRTYYLSERDLCWLGIRGLRHLRPEVAANLAKLRLRPLLHRLVDVDQAERAATDLLSLINSGDEYAVALLPALPEAGVLAKTRQTIVRNLLPAALVLPESAFRSLFADPSPAVREAALERAAALPLTEGMIEEIGLLLVDPREEVVSLARRVLGVIEQQDDVLTVQDVMVGERWRIGVLLARLRWPELALGDLRTMLAEGSDETRGSLLDLLGEIGHGVHHQAELVVECRRPGVAGARAIQALARGSLNDEHRSNARTLIRSRLNDPSSLVREAAIDALVALEGQDAVWGLTLLLADADPSVRIRAGIRLAQLGQWRGLETAIEGLEMPEFRVPVQEAIRTAAHSLVPGEVSELREWLLEVGLLEANHGD